MSHLEIGISHIQMVREIHENTDSRKTLCRWTLKGKEMYSVDISTIHTAYGDSDPLHSVEMIYMKVMEKS
jgi:hypothetical protein